jgi:hypothetical protein
MSVVFDPQFVIKGTVRQIHSTFPRKCSCVYLEKFIENTAEKTAIPHRKGSRR